MIPVAWRRFPYFVFKKMQPGTLLVDTTIDVGQNPGKLTASSDAEFYLGLAIMMFGDFT